MKYYDSEMWAGKEWEIQSITRQNLLYPLKTYQYYEHNDGHLSFRIE